MNADKTISLLHRDLTDRVIGIFYEVYNEIGFGFLESVYEAAMCHALRDAGVSFERQKMVSIQFRGEVVAEFRLDLVVEQAVVVEVKAASTLSRAHEAQLLNYLKATDLRVGLLLNFGPRAEFRRRVFDSSRLDPRLSA